MSETKETTIDDSRTVHLVSQEGESFDVLMNVAKMSELVKTMIDEEQDEEEAQEIPLPNVKSGILAKIIEFMQHYRSDPMNEIEKVTRLLFNCFGYLFLLSRLSLQIWQRLFKIGTQITYLWSKRFYLS